MDEPFEGLSELIRVTKPEVAFNVIYSKNTDQEKS